MNSDLSTASAALADEQMRVVRSASGRVMVCSSIEQNALLFHCRSGVFHEVEPAILSPAQEVGDIVSIKVDDSRADVVSFDILLRKRAGVLERPHAILETSLLQEVSIRTVEEEVDFPIAIPVGHAQLPTPAFTRRSWIQPKRL